MTMRLLWLLVTTFMLVSAERAAWAQQASPPRFALIIGNANYPDADAPLKEPLADARALAAELKRDGVGFDVDIAENLSKDGMLRAFNRFYGKIANGSTALVFFSGYAIQSARQSYIIPVDGQIWRETDVPRDGVSLEQILREMNSRGARVKIAILDASRRNPYERRIRKFSTGLAPVDAPTGSLVMYSSAPSTVVNETGGEQRLFVNELLKQLRVAELTADEVFNRTRMGVSQGTQGQQVPWVSNSLVSVFLFDQRAKVAAAPVTPPPVVAPSSTPGPAVTPSAPSTVQMPTMAPVVPESRPNTPPPPPAAQTPNPGPVAALQPPAATTNPPSTPVTPALPPKAMSAGDLAAIQDLNRAIRANPNDAIALYRRGMVYAKNDDFSKAVVDFDATIRLNPRDAEALNNRCWVRAMLGELQAALRDCDSALQIKPDSADSLDSRGFVKLKIGQAQNAISDYDAALRISARKASSLYGRGIAKLRIGSSGGQTDIADAKTIDPGIAEEFAKYGIR